MMGLGAVEVIIIVAIIVVFAWTVLVTLQMLRRKQ
jgi:hypothetical protein